MSDNRGVVYLGTRHASRGCEGPDSGAAKSFVIGPSHRLTKAA